MLFIERACISIPPSQEEKCRLMHTITAKGCGTLFSFCSLPLADGPVTVGMSLDIASIDTISEINMVRRVPTTCSPAVGALIGVVNEA